MSQLETSMKLMINLQHLVGGGVGAGVGLGNKTSAWPKLVDMCFIVIRFYSPIMCYPWSIVRYLIAPDHQYPLVS